MKKFLSVISSFLLLALIVGVTPSICQAKWVKVSEFQGEGFYIDDKSIFGLSYKDFAVDAKRETKKPVTIYFVTDGEFTTATIGKRQIYVKEVSFLLDAYRWIMHNFWKKESPV